MENEARNAKLLSEIKSLYDLVEYKENGLKVSDKPLYVVPSLNKDITMDIYDSLKVLGYQPVLFDSITKAQLYYHGEDCLGEDLNEENIYLISEGEYESISKDMQNLPGILRVCIDKDELLKNYNMFQKAGNVAAMVSYLAGTES